MKAIKKSTSGSSSRSVESSWNGAAMNKKRIRVLVVDDSRLIRELLSDALAEHADMQVVGVAADGQEALVQAAKLQPDIITLDLQMPRLGGLETLDKIL